MNLNIYMELEIWSDIMCPFCYMGKRRLEKALNMFQHAEEVQVKWHSFQLQPDAQYEPGRDIYDFLAEAKDMPRQQAIKMNTQVTNMAKKLGLEYDFDKAVVANTLDGHRLIKLSASQGLQEETTERLFAAYFTEGRNIGDQETLIELGTEVGLKAEAIRQLLKSDEFKKEVKDDQKEAEELGIEAVPFFVFNRKYGISGAQPTEVILQGLQRIWAEENPDRTQLNEAGNGLA